LDSIARPPSIQHRAPRAASRIVAAPHARRVPLRRTGTVVLVGAIAALHGAAIIALGHGARPRPVPAAPVPIAIALVTPRVIPPPPPPPRPSAQPLRARQIASAPRPAAQPEASFAPLVPADTPLVVAAADIVPVVTAPSVPAPPAPPAAEKVTEPRGYAGYLNNPPPTYPTAAQKRGLQGQVVLKVHVLASGHPDDVTVARSSGYGILDEAALRAVSQWTFEPARRGQAPIDGWVQVPLNFKI
jgi:protein TonB